ncbi:hypothetical protein TNCV_5078281 [Trichonephila clavipes]|uniref:Uncharacterized protein n=1 Tax=Trichonephila clavipes TaxID=2585209 RepID=A0A8X6S1S8_TRICX|nr:hypothetical protein TNCV_5078281 [Trichonephila clavipes]
MRIRLMKMVQLGILIIVLAEESNNIGHRSWWLKGSDTVAANEDGGCFPKICASVEDDDVVTEEVDCDGTFGFEGYESGCSKFKALDILF